MENQAENMFWHTWVGSSFDFYDERRLRDMFAEFGIHPDAVFGCALLFSASLVRRAEQAASSFPTQFPDAASLQVRDELPAKTE